MESFHSLRIMCSVTFILLSTISFTEGIVKRATDFDDDTSRKSLILISENFHNLTAEQPSEQSFQSLVNYYEAIVNISGNVTAVYNTIGSQIQTDTFEIMFKLALSEVDINLEQQSSVSFKIVNGTTAMDEYSEIFVLQTDWLEICVKCIVSRFISVGLVVFPRKRSLFRPLPNSEYPITNFKVFDLLLLKDEAFSDLSAKNNCSDDSFFDFLTMYWRSSSSSPSIRVACAEWSETDGGWTSEGCFSFANVSASGYLTCRCDTKNNRNVTEYIVYETVQDTEENFRFDINVAVAKNRSDFTELSEYLQMSKDIATQPKDSSGFVHLVSTFLPKILSFEDSLLDNVTNASFMGDIGTILTNVVPENGSCMIGRGNNVVSAFVFLPRTYRHDPLVGFNFDKNRAQWMSYYRTKEVDINKLFAHDAEFSLLFSDSVARQNTRYAFLVYPTNKFFLSRSTIAEYKVLTSRVVDVVLVPFDITQGRRDQMLHMFYNPISLSAKVGCARWSLELNRWTDSGCSVNPSFFRGVCTCNIDTGSSRKPSREQFVVYQYRDADIYFVGRPDYENNFKLDDGEWYPFELHNLQRNPVDTRTTIQAENVLSFISYSLLFYKMDDVALEQFMEDTRYLWTVGECVTKLPQENHYYNFGAVCSSPKDSNDSTAIIAFKFKMVYFNWIETFAVEDNFTTANLLESNDTLNKETVPSVYAIRASASMVSQNSKYSFLVFPLDKTLKPLPLVDTKIYKSRVVDIVLVPRDGSRDDVPQFVEVYINPWASYLSLGCAYWSTVLNDWTTLGCTIFTVDDIELCNCSLATNALQSRTGGLYLAYHYSKIYFDKDVFARLGTADLVADADSVFDQGANLILNASRLPEIGDDVVVNTFQTYVRVLSIPTIANRTAKMQQILENIDTTMGRYMIGLEMFTASFGIPGSWSVRSAGIAKDLFSNAVLSSNDTHDISISSNMAFFALCTPSWHFKPIPGAEGTPKGLYIELVGSTEVARIDFGQKDPDWPIFACYIDKGITDYTSLIVLVYPNNMSPFPMTMTDNPIFNARQFDIYIIGDPTPVELNIMYQPAKKQERYIMLKCASWDNEKSTWIEDYCAFNETDSDCHCAFENGSDIIRIIAYQYTAVPNFSLIDTVDAPLVIFMIGAFLSFFGLLAIALTALIFPNWRMKLSNKILMNLSASVLLNLGLTSYRETHEIYADTNHNNVGLIFFTVCVHYAQLTHYCWGLAMSLLQYRRFSKIVGATTIPHLLIKVSFFAWGAPLIPLVVLLSWDQQIHFCSPDKMTHYVLYLVPGAIITLVDIGLMVGIVYHITDKCGTGKEADLQRHNVKDRDQLKRRLKTVVLMFFLFGISTVFEMFNDITEHVASIDYFSKILDPVQGFVLFLFFIVLDGRTRNLWASHCLEGRSETFIRKKVIFRHSRL